MNLIEEIKEDLKNLRKKVSQAKDYDGHFIFFENGLTLQHFNKIQEKLLILENKLNTCKKEAEEILFNYESFDRFSHEFHEGKYEGMMQVINSLKEELME